MAVIGFVAAAFGVVTQSFAGTAGAAEQAVSLWSDADVPGTVDVDDAQPVELGTRFRADRGGDVTGVRFYKSAANTGPHTGSLWEEDGTLLATVTFGGETASGWQNATFAAPVTIAADRFYVVSYHTTAGHYSADNNGFAQARDAGPLHAPASTPERPNGLYRYGSGGFPTSTWAATNYWVDVTFVPSAVTTPSASPSPSVSPPPTGGAFPDAGNTGVPDGVQLTPYTGSCSFRTDNQVIDGKIVDCADILVYARNVTFRNSVLNRAVMTNAADASVSVVDSEVRAGATTWAGVGGSNLTVLRSEITGGQHSVRCDGNCLVQDSYLHDQFNDPDSAFGYHNNAFLTNGGSGMVVRHNTLWCSPPDNAIGGGCTADLALFGDFAPVENVTVEDNYLHATPGGFCGSFGYNPGKAFGDNPTGVVVRGNVFGRGANGRCGGVGPTTSFLGTGAGNEWAANTWDDGGAVDPQ
ncbi:hypothetical protein Val02_05790 [Virgisporangium aliadipatigenens]|uniref:DUF4082 domain-containing protein n=1 Tax=Virgisporangium aliadipatigenens TaxID=741659 RepID=A0A8J4DNL2_9ACTN|nr:hypothetical protein Val02_05790 [Virgisporangium aliadipatigenens]